MVLYEFNSHGMIIHWTCTHCGHSQRGVRGHDHDAAAHESKCEFIRGSKEKV